MIISNFTVPELEYFREHCGFNGIELYVFELRSQGASLDDIRFILGTTIDIVKKISQRVNRKIINVL